MPSDYKDMGNPPPAKKTLPGFLWLLSGLIIGLFVALIVYLDKQPDDSIGFKEAVQIELDKIKKNAATKPSNSSHKKLDTGFNFYTILPEMEVFIHEDELKPTESVNNNGPINIDVSGKDYILQAGSFKNSDDAERLKASLALLGLEANLQTVSVNYQQWHRVRIGPYNNAKDLYNSLNLLKENGIKALPLEIQAN